MRKRRALLEQVRRATTFYLHIFVPNPPAKFVLLQTRKVVVVRFFTIPLVPLLYFHTTFIGLS